MYKKVFIFQQMISSASVASAVILAATCITWAAPEKPNILYINADDLGVMDLGYNNPKFRTPNINRLTEEGMLFTQAYAPSANCAPSRACVHSGQWSARHGVYTVKSSERGSSAHRKLIPTKNTAKLTPEVYTMAEALKDGGYRTIHLGKYHIGGDPLKDGFDVNVGGDETGSPAGGFFAPWENGSMKKWSEKVPAKTHRLDIYVDEAIRFMAAHKEESMFIHFSPYMVHAPLQAVPEYEENYADTGLNVAYASMVEKLDEAVGKLMAALEAEGLAENTLVIFCSDNGGVRSFNSQKPLRAGKGSYYEGGIREPLIMRWPAKIKPGSTNAELVNSLDFYPTFMEAAGVKLPERLDGVSLMPLMIEAGDWEPVTQFWHFPVYLQAYRGEKKDCRDPLFRTRPGSAMRLGKWKLHEYFEDGALELYDLEADPAEGNDLSKINPEKASELHRILKAWRAEINAPVPTELNSAYNEKIEKSAIRKLRKN